MSTATAVYCLPRQGVVMDYGPSHAQGQDYQQRTNGTGGDMPTGYRPCPFCHFVIPWESERCPSCGRILIERVGPGSSQRPPSVSRSAGRNSWWSVGVHPVLARLRNAVLRAGQRSWTRVRSTSRESWSTTSRGTSWSAFQPARSPVRPRWLGSIPTPTERERQILFIASALMVVLFVVALLIR
jgi:hypothetical protein